jgi:hypothetical protein
VEEGAAKDGKGLTFQPASGPCFENLGWVSSLVLHHLLPFLIAEGLADPFAAPTSGGGLL